MEANFVKGEKLEQKYEVKEASKDQIGSLYLTNYRLIFLPNGKQFDESLQFQMPWGVIQRMQEKSNTDKMKCSVELTCKDERVVKFRFTNQGQAFLQTCNIIRKYALPKKMDQIFASQWVGLSLKTFDWKAVSEESQKDFERMGLTSLFSGLGHTNINLPGGCLVLPGFE